MRVNHPGKILRRLTGGTSAKMTLCSVAFLLLTGAQGDSCLPGDPEPTDPPAPPPDTEVCPPGSHQETICGGGEVGYGAHHPGPGPDCGNPDGPPLPAGQTGSGAYDGYTGSGCEVGHTGSHEPGCNCGCGGGCYDICVPDEVCPPGTYEEWICEDPSQPLDFCDAPEGCPPEPGQCYPLCVPFEPCGPDMHEEWICYGEPPPPPEGPCLDPNGCEPPLPGETCDLLCVPNDGCGPGIHEEWVCDEPPPPPDGPCLDPDGCLPPEPTPGDCYPTCVPDGPCPPGSEVIIACDEQLGECWAECAPTDPGCPPDMVPEPICDEWDCWIECVPL